MSSPTIDQNSFILAHVNLPEVHRLDRRYAVEEDSGVFRVFISDDTSVTNVEVSPVPAPDVPLESVGVSFPPSVSTFFKLF